MIEKFIGLHRINGKLERVDNIEYNEADENYEDQCA